MDEKTRKAILKDYADHKNLGHLIAKFRRVSRQEVYNVLTDAGLRVSACDLYRDVRVQAVKFDQDRDPKSPGNFARAHELKHCRVWRRGEGTITDSSVAGNWVEPPSVVLAGRA